MFSVKLIARPDPRMVEVPLDVEAELPREFEGAAVLSSSGLPRKVRLKAQRDQVKLSTAYRADQLVADIVKAALRAAPEDVERAQAAARAFLRAVRERRQEGATLLVASNGGGRVEVSQTAPPHDAPRPSRPPPPAADRRVAHLEARVAHLEARLAELEARPPPPSSEPRETRRAMLRRATAIEAFADGLRSDLRQRVATHVELAAQAAARLDRASNLDAENDAEQLRTAAAEASAREQALRRLLEEMDLYPTADLALVERLVVRLLEGVPPAAPTASGDSRVPPVPMDAAPESSSAALPVANDPRVVPLLETDVPEPPSTSSSAVVPPAPAGASPDATDAASQTQSSAGTGEPRG